MHALCAHAQGSVDLHVESYGVAGPLVETLYIKRATAIERLHERIAQSVLNLHTVPPAIFAAARSHACARPAADAQPRPAAAASGRLASPDAIPWRLGVVASVIVSSQRQPGTRPKDAGYENQPENRPRAT